MMTSLLQRLLILSSVIVASCGGGDSSGAHSDASGSNGSNGSGHVYLDSGIYDFGCGGNTACPTSQVCCATPGTTTTFACVAPSSCPAADQIFCDGPDECGGTTPVCCGVDVGKGTGTYPTCDAKSIGTSCTSAASCPTHLATSCSDTSKVVICHVAADCTDSTNNMCCTFTSGAAALTFCTDATTAQFGGGVCH